MTEVTTKAGHDPKCNVKWNPVWSCVCRTETWKRLQLKKHPKERA